MIDMLISTLFAASACLALGAIAGSWRAHGAAALDLRRRLRECPAMRDFRVTLVTTVVCVEPPSATIYRPEFRPAARSLPLAPALRAAA